MRYLRLSDLLVGFDPSKRKTYKYLASHLEEAIKNATNNESEEEQKKARSLAKCLHDRGHKQVMGQEKLVSLHQ